MAQDSGRCNDFRQSVYTMFGKKADVVVSFNYDSITYTRNQIQKSLQKDGYMKIILAKDPKKSVLRPNMQIKKTHYYATAIYILSRPVHKTTEFAPVGELVIENESTTNGKKVYACALLQNGFNMVPYKDGVDAMIANESGEISLNHDILGGKASLYNNDSILVWKYPITIQTSLREYAKFLTGDVFTVYEIPETMDNATVVETRHDTSEGAETLIEGFDFGTNIASIGKATKGFSTFNTDVGEAGKTFNKAGEDYIFNFDKNSSGASKGKTPSTVPASEMLNCVPVYSNTDQVSTIVVPYGSAITDDVSRMFMTGTFQMFYTILVTFLVLFLTPILYRNYFSIAMRHGSADSIEYGNKITYSTNMYFGLYAFMMILGVIIDASMYNASVDGVSLSATTEMALGIMLIVLTVCTYLFAYMLRGFGFDPNVYGHLNTSMQMSDYFNKYLQFMGQNTNYVALIAPAFLIALMIVIIIPTYQSKTCPESYKCYPFGALISLFFVGLYGVLVTFGAFMNKSNNMMKADIVI